MNNETEAMEDRAKAFLDAAYKKWDSDANEWMGTDFVYPAVAAEFALQETAALTDEVTRLKSEVERREELEVVAAALYLGHDDAKEQFEMYKAVYLTGKEQK